MSEVELPVVELPVVELPAAQAAEATVPPEENMVEVER